MSEAFTIFGFLHKQNIECGSQLDIYGEDLVMIHVESKCLESGKRMWKQ